MRLRDRVSGEPIVPMVVMALRAGEVELAEPCLVEATALLAIGREARVLRQRGGRRFLRGSDATLLGGAGSG